MDREKFRKYRKLCGLRQDETGTAMCMCLVKVTKFEKGLIDINEQQKLRFINHCERVGREKLQELQAMLDDLAAEKRKMETADIAAIKEKYR